MTDDKNNKPIKPKETLKTIKSFSPEERIQFIYKEIFYISEKVTELTARQTDLEKLLVNLLKEYSNIKSFNEKFLK